MEVDSSGSHADASRSERIRPFHCEARLADLRWVCWSDAGELRANIVNNVEIAVRTVVVAEAEIGADCLRVGSIHLKHKNFGIISPANKNAETFHHTIAKAIPSTTVRF